MKQTAHHTIAVMFCLLALSAYGQQADPAAHAAGKIKDDITVSKNGAVVSQYHININALKAAVQKLNNIILQNPVMKQPAGFSPYVSFFMEQPDKAFPWLKIPSGIMDIEFHDLVTDEQTHTIHPMTAYGTGLQVRFNSTRYLYNSLEERQTMLDHHLPAFFMIQSLGTSTGYTTFKSSNGNPITVITNGKPIFIPFTRAQYLNYQIAYDQDAAGKFEADYEKDLKDLNDTKRYVASMSKEKAASIGADQAIKGKEKLPQMDLNNKNLWKKRAAAHRQQLAALSTADKQAPAYISGKQGTDITLTLSSPGDPDSFELWTINPHYFNADLPPGAIQLITVSFHTSGDADYIQHSVKEMQEEMDYQQLKALIQK